MHGILNRMISKTKISSSTHNLLVLKKSEILVIDIRMVIRKRQYQSYTGIYLTIASGNRALAPMGAGKTLSLMIQTKSLRPLQCTRCWNHKIRYFWTFGCNKIRMTISLATLLCSLWKHMYVHQFTFVPFSSFVFRSQLWPAYEMRC